jgi:hypothetical protein
VTWRVYRLARGGPSPQARLPWERKHQKGFDVYRLVVGGQLTGRVIPTVVRHEALLVRMEVGFLRCRAVVAVG